MLLVLLVGVLLITYCPAADDVPAALVQIGSYFLRNYLALGRSLWYGSSLVGRLRMKALSAVRLRPEGRGQTIREWREWARRRPRGQRTAKAEIKSKIRIRIKMGTEGRGSGERQTETI